MMLHFLMTLNQHKNQKLRHSLTSETMGKMINRIPGLCLLISSLPGLSLRTHVESTSVLKALPGKLDIKRHSPSILCFEDMCVKVENAINI